jgi:thiol:disulfide interchange protein
MPIIVFQLGTGSVRACGVAVFLALALLAGGQFNQCSAQEAKDTLPTKYDPARNAEQDIENALAEARRTHKNILLEVGGEWCVWCHIMDKFFATNPDLLAFRDSHYITVKINVSSKNENKAILSKYPSIPGYPHLFVLDPDGTLLRSQFTGDLEAGKSYNHDKLMAFLKKWAPPS